MCDVLFYVLFSEQPSGRGGGPTQTRVQPVVLPLGVGAQGPAGLQGLRVPLQPAGPGPVPGTLLR